MFSTINNGFIIVLSIFLIAASFLGMDIFNATSEQNKKDHSSQYHFLAVSSVLGFLGLARIAYLKFT